MTPDSEYLAILRAAYDYAREDDDEISIEKTQIVLLLARSDNGWWKVKAKGVGGEYDCIGNVPASYLEQAVHVSVVKALYDFSATIPDELSVKEDEILYVFDSEDEWYLVQTPDRRRLGYVPKNYVETITEEEASTLAEHDTPQPGADIRDFLIGLSVDLSRWYPDLQKQGMSTESDFLAISGWSEERLDKLFSKLLPDMPTFHRQVLIAGVVDLANNNLD